MPSTLCDEGLTEMIFFRTFLMKRVIGEVWLPGAALALFSCLGSRRCFCSFCKLVPGAEFGHSRSTSMCAPLAIDAVVWTVLTSTRGWLATLGLSMEVWAPAL